MNSSFISFLGLAFVLATSANAQIRDQPSASIALADDSASSATMKPASANMTATSKLTNKIFVDNGKIRLDLNIPRLQIDHGLTTDMIIEKVKAAYAALQSYSDAGIVVGQSNGYSVSTNFKIRLQRPDFSRIDWQGPVLGEGVEWSDGTGHFGNESDDDLMATSDKQPDQRILRIALFTLGIDAEISDLFFHDVDCWLDLFLWNHQRENDQTVGGVNCYVVFGVHQFNGMTDSTTLWIGRKDYLIHRLHTLRVAWPKEQPIENSSVIAALEKRKAPVTPRSIADLKSRLIVEQRTNREELKSGPIEGTESHVDIVTNKAFMPTDFKPEAK